MNMKYTFSANIGHDHFLGIKIECKNINANETFLQLPAWRPGRYELANFAKNVRDLVVLDSNGNQLTTKKVSKDKWHVNTENINAIVVKYTYYAAELNAGSTYSDENQMYVNPVNCCMYVVGKETEEIKVQLILPNDYDVATGLTNVKKHVYSCSSFDELADSPFIASKSLQKFSYSVGETQFHCWFQGIVKVDEEKLLNDFKKFSAYQIQKMGSIPVDEYHFLFQISTDKAYHGVEHLNSTVILLGPSFSVFKDRYVDLLGVSSHELFHSWNIKAIRPVEMFPYDFTKENYSELGFVAEGVTTYIGDRALYEAGVFDLNQYKIEVINYLKRHYHSDGRLHYDVASSSFDTWLDGYEKGIPGRKVSIYTEGMLIAYICDMRIRENTNGSKDIYDVMKKLYDETGLKSGYSEEMYKGALEEIGGCSFDDVFEDLVHGVNDFKPYLDIAFKYDQLKMELKDSFILSENYGLKGKETENGFEVIDVLEHSAAHLSGVVEGDKILVVNGIFVKDNFNQWLDYFKEEEVSLEVLRNSKTKNIRLTQPTNAKYFEIELIDIR